MTAGDGTGGRGEGWTDLALTFADAGLVAPPLPDGLRGELVRVGDWCWTTRTDINPVEMYFFDRYVQEAFEGPVGDYAAVCHAGHGTNSYGLNLHLVHGGVGWFVQHGWGGVYMDPVATRTAIAFTYAVLREFIEYPLVSARVDHVVAYGDFRGVCLLHSRELTESPVHTGGVTPAMWVHREFTSERTLWAVAADTLCPERTASLVSSMRAAFDA